MVKSGLIVCSKILLCKFKVGCDEICKRGLVMGVFCFLELTKDDSTCLVRLCMFWMLGMSETSGLSIKKCCFSYFCAAGAAEHWLPSSRP